MHPYGYKRGQENGSEPWENPKNFLKSKKCDRQKAKKEIEEEKASSAATEEAKS